MTEGTATLVATEYKISIEKREKKSISYGQNKLKIFFSPPECKRKWENMKTESTEEQAKVPGIPEETRTKAKTEKKL